MGNLHRNDTPWCAKRTNRSNRLKTCPNCGATFYANYLTQKTCSHKCNWEQKRIGMQEAKAGSL